MKPALLCAVVLVQLTDAARVTGQNATVVPSADSSAPYLGRGNEVERRYRDYRGELERFYNALTARVEREAPDLRPKLLPPAAVPFGYQILPSLLVEAPWQPRPARVVLSPFSWSRTESLIDRNTTRLAATVARFRDSTLGRATERRSDVEFAVGEYVALLAAQKLAAGQIEYNRLWQTEVARDPRFFEAARARQRAALERQALLDSLSIADGQHPSRRARVDSLAGVINAAIAKLPTPGFVRIVHPDAHRWILEVPVYTDIEDSAFVERFRVAIESAWHVRNGNDDYRVSLDIRRLTPARLYVNARVPAKGEHIDIASHIARFPTDGAVLTTGANTIYSIGRVILPGPHAVGPSALVHEFGHVLGFRDGYFRSARDQGADGYEIVEVILDPETIVAAPERGRVRLEHFLQTLGERR